MPRPRIKPPTEAVSFRLKQLNDELITMFDTNELEQDGKHSAAVNFLKLKIAELELRIEEFELRIEELDLIIEEFELRIEELEDK